jgi:hypothetical protein
MKKVIPEIFKTENEMKVASKHQKSNQIIISCMSNICLCQKTGPTFIIIFFFKLFVGPQTMGKQLLNFITCGCESSAPFLQFTKLGVKPRRIGDKVV